MGEYYDRYLAMGPFYDAPLYYLSLEKIPECLFYLLLNYITFIHFLNVLGYYYLLILPENLQFKYSLKVGLVSIIHSLFFLFWLRSI